MLLPATSKDPSSVQKIVTCSVSAVGIMGIVLAIATSAAANTSYTPGQAESEAATAAEIEAAANRAGLERLRARLLSPKRTVEAPPAHGTYHYGQQPIADQPETAYFVFESQGTNIEGALYMPSSSFDCVQGQIIEQRMALSVTDSYSQETYSYALTLNEPFIEIASQQGTIASPPNIDGFYPLPMREQDRAILATCQAI